MHSRIYLCRRMCHVLYLQKAAVVFYFVFQSRMDPHMADVQCTIILERMELYTFFFLIIHFLSEMFTINNILAKRGEKAFDVEREAKACCAKPFHVVRR